MFTSCDRHEVHCAKRYLDYTETENFRVFRDKTNPESFESNYAVLKSMQNENDTFLRVEMFLANLDGVPAKFRWRPDAVPLAKARALFERHGYEIAAWEQRYMLHTGAPAQGLHAAECLTRCCAELSLEEKYLVRASYGGADYGLRMLERQLAAGARAVFAYNKANVPVSFCLAEAYGSAMCISDVYTPPPCRGQGCAARVLQAALVYAQEAACADVFLYTESEQAQRLYEKVGFTVAENRTLYWAFKGGLPTWMKNA